DVLARRTTAGDIALADLRRVLIHVGGGGESFGAARHNVLDLRWSCGVGWWALRGVEGGDATAGAGADVDQAASVAKRAGNGIYNDGNFGQRLLDGCGDLRIFVVNDARDLQSRLCIQALGRGVRSLRGECVELQGRAVLGFWRGGLFKHGKGSHSTSCWKSPDVLLIRF